MRRTIPASLSCRLSACRLGTFRHARRRSGFTLLEVMIATAITLLMMISMVQVFKVISDSMKQGRAAMQMNSSLRSVTTRLRQDLANLTVRVDPPSDTSSGGGYFMYMDGSQTDYTASLYAGDAPRSNRFGDTDDIAMFTARAGAGSWFSGQVPRYIIDPPIPGNPPDPTPVVITSQLAEIAVFARPVRSPATPVTQNFDDFDGNHFPDSFRLHYRVLLIRPDLNTVGTTALRTLPVMSIPSATDTPTTMATYFGNCDLSMHRVYDGDGTVNDLITANSLEDLANPANRFAHYQYRLDGLGTNGSCTMPLLVLDPIPNTELTAVSAGLYPDPNPAQTPPAQLLGANGNYLNPAYVLGFINSDRTGEDVIANNILAFDIKGYDPAAPVIAIPGTDGSFGIPTGGAPPFTNVAGQEGSDDLILTPSDPGYAAAYAGTFSIVSYGEYVDLMWGRKALNSLGSYSLTYASISGSSPPPNLFTALSGLESASPLLYTDGMLRSGKAITLPSGLGILQPTYDTWTTAFDTNGTSQALYSSLAAGSAGTIDINALVRKNGQGSQDAVGVIDRGTDGLDNNGSGGIDEMAERETMPPFPIRLRGIKISVRIEDLRSRQIKQMSVASEFATQ